MDQCVNAGLSPANLGLIPTSTDESVDSVRKDIQSKLRSCTRKVPLYTWAHPSLHNEGVCLSLSLSVSVLTTIFQLDLCWSVPECLHSGFYWS